MQAVGAYFQELRDARNESRAAVASALGVTENTIWRVETGRQEPGASLLIALVRYLHARWEDVQALMARNDAQAIDGKQAALEHLRAAGLWTEEDDEIVRRIRQLDPDRRRVIDQLLDTWPDDAR